MQKPITPKKQKPSSVDKRIRATHGSADRPLKIGDIEIPCYTLSDGRAVIVLSGMMKALNLTGSHSAHLARFTGSRALKPFISAELSDLLNNPITFTLPRGGTAQGYEATILIDICNAVILAQDAGLLKPQQEHVAQRAKILVMAFAKTGIVAVVHDVSGYQADRKRGELNKILEGFIAKEMRGWTKQFPDEFYKHIFRLHGWPWDPRSLKRPGYVGHLTNWLVYEQLPPGVLDELRRRNPPAGDRQRAHKHHQFLTPDIGHPQLQRQIQRVVDLLTVSATWSEFMALFERTFLKSPWQEELWSIESGPQDVCHLKVMQ